MSDKSDLRKLRESRWYTRAQVAKMLGTTVHYVWCAEMPPYTAPEVAERMWALLGSPSDPPPPNTGEGRGAPSTPKHPTVWVCPRCQVEHTVPIKVQAISHLCRLAHGAEVAMRPKERQDDE